MASPTATVAAAPPLPAWALWAGLMGVGVCWGMTQIFMKTAMAGGFHPLGAALWQAGVGALVAGAALAWRGGRMPWTLGHWVFFAACGLLGTALPASLSFASIVHLPVGVQALVISTVPLMTVALALPMGLERVGPRRLGGLLLGLLGVAMIVLPESSLPGAGQIWWVALPVLSALSYATENVVIDRFRPPGTEALQIGCGLLACATLMLIPPVVVLDLAVWPADPSNWRALADMLAVTLFNIVSYLGFVWLIGHAGPVFASQVGYVVTATGVVTGMLFLGERHAWGIWVAMALLFAGIALVSPRRAP
ncbi:MAG: DMT family transporter [Pseudomonadota bacterium]